MTVPNFSWWYLWHVLSNHFSARLKYDRSWIDTHYIYTIPRSITNKLTILAQKNWILSLIGRFSARIRACFTLRCRREEKESILESESINEASLWSRNKRKQGMQDFTWLLPRLFWVIIQHYFTSLWSLLSVNFTWVLINLYLARVTWFWLPALNV